MLSFWMGYHMTEKIKLFVNTVSVACVWQLSYWQSIQNECPSFSTDPVTQNYLKSLPGVQGMNFLSPFQAEGHSFWWSRCGRGISEGACPQLEGTVCHYLQLFLSQPMTFAFCASKSPLQSAAECRGKGARGGWGANEQHMVWSLSAGRH